MFDSAHPTIQMRMAGQPDQHGAGDAEIVMLPIRAGIDRAAFPPFWHERLKLRIGAAHHVIVRNANPLRA